MLSEARALDKIFEESREARLREQEARRREQELRDAVQKGIFDELHHLSEVQEKQQEGIDGVAASTAALAKSSKELYPWQKWGTLTIIILTVVSIAIAVFIGVRGGLI
jgi:RNase adaptor protein for sRNA GlmZ degradation